MQPLQVHCKNYLSKAHKQLTWKYVLVQNKPLTYIRTYFEFFLCNRGLQFVLSLPRVGKLLRNVSDISIPTKDVFLLRQNRPCQWRSTWLRNEQFVISTTRMTRGRSSRSKPRPRPGPGFTLWPPCHLDQLSYLWRLWLITHLCWSLLIFWSKNKNRTTNQFFWKEREILLLAFLNFPVKLWQQVSPLFQLFPCCRFWWREKW